MARPTLAELTKLEGEISHGMNPATYRQSRKACGLTSDALAQMLGVSRFTIMRREAGVANIADEAWMAMAQVVTTYCPKAKRPPHWQNVFRLYELHQNAASHAEAATL